jgi:hypothetical protein
MNQYINGIQSVLTSVRAQEKYDEALSLKEISLQINILVHAYGILLALPKILEPGEKVENLSLGARAGSGEFDVVTSDRIIEFKFAKWTGGDSGRKKAVFNDYLKLCKDTGEKKAELYCLDAELVKAFLDNPAQRQRLEKELNHASPKKVTIHELTKYVPNSLLES